MQEYLVCLKSTEDRQDFIYELEDRGIEFKSFKRLPRHFLLWAENEEFNQLNQDVRIKEIDSNSAARISNIQLIDRYRDNWGLARIDQRKLPAFINNRGDFNYTRRGRNVDIYIVDTGINYDHEDFTRRVVRQYDFYEYHTEIEGVRFENLTVNASLIVNGVTVNLNIGDQLTDVVSKIQAANIPDVDVLTAQDPSIPDQNVLKLASGKPTKTVDITISSSSSQLLHELGLTVGTYSGNNERWANDYGGHGTHVAGIAGGFRYGVAKKANLFSFSAFDSNGNSRSNIVVDSLDAALDHHILKTSNNPSVLNASWTFFGVNGAVEEAIQELLNSGVVVVAAAGNFGSDAGNFTPARMEDVITVGSTNINDSISSFSNISDIDNLSDPVADFARTTNIGRAVDLFAPGDGIVSTWKNGTTSTNIKSGTSMSSPHVAGVVAMFLENETKYNSIIDVLNIKNELIDKSTKDVIKNVSADTNNRLLYSFFVGGQINWITEQGSLGTFNQGSSVNITLEANYITPQNDSEPVEFQLTSGSLPSGLTFQNGEITGTLDSVSNDQEFNFVVTANYENESSTRTFSITVLQVNKPPVWQTTSGSLGEFDEGDAVNLSVLAIDPESVGVSYSIISGSLPPGLTLSSGNISGTIDDISSDTTFQFVIRASDGEKVSDRQFSISVNQINLSPVWQTPPGLLQKQDNTNPIEGQVFSFQLQASDPENDSIEYNVVSGNLPNGLTLDTDTGLINGLIDDDSGDYQFDVAITDGINNPVTQTFTIRVLSISGNKPPTWITPSGQLGAFDENQAINIPLQVSDPENDVLNFYLGDPITVGAQEVNGLPDGVTLSSSGLISGIVPLNTISEVLNSQDFIFNVVVEDTQGNTAQRRFVLEIIQIGENKPPVWVTPSDLGEVNEYERIKISLVAEDPEGGYVHYKRGQGGRLPKGITLNENTGDLEGIVPCVDEDTTYSFSVQASDGERTTTKQFSFVVKNVFDGDIWDVSVDLSGHTKIDWINNAFSIVGNEEIYRKSDINFGIVDHPELHMIQGINLFPEQFNATGLTVELETTFDGDTTTFDNNTSIFDFQEEKDASDVFAEFLGPHHQKHNVIIGGLEYAVARDENNDIEYEVIYRPIIDRSRKDGYTVPYNHRTTSFVDFGVAGTQYDLGDEYSKFEIAVYIDEVQIPFEEYETSGNDLVLNTEPDGDKLQVYFVTQPRFDGDLVYDDFDYLTPASINNMRRELIESFGLAAPELLPEWMRTEQVLNDPSTIPGYVPNIPVAYVKPGTAQEIINRVNNDPFMGCVIEIDRYHIRADACQEQEQQRIRFDRSGQTTWNDDTSTYDNDTTTFDLFAETTFDSDTTQFDVFQSNISKINKYIKFPPGDVVGV